jgi:hypothetical protein
MSGSGAVTAIISVAMIGIAVSSLARIVISTLARRMTDLEVDGHNVVFGAAMVGMLNPATKIVSPGPSTLAWILLWSAITAWFATSICRDVIRGRRGRRFVVPHVPHLVVSGAMVYLLSSAEHTPEVTHSSNAMAHMTGMSHMSAGSPAWLPTLDYALVVFMLGYFVSLIDYVSPTAWVASERGPDVGVDESASRHAIAPREALIVDAISALTMAYSLTMMFR